MAITAAKTLSLIAAYGADAVFLTDTAAFDPATSLTTRTGAAAHTIKVVEENRETRLVGDVDVQIYASPSGMTFTPAVGGRVTYKDRTWTMVAVKPIVFQGTTVLYEIGMKGGGAVSTVAIFNAEMMDFAKNLGPQEARVLQRKIALTALGELIVRTPVDTGRARANWQVGINRDFDAPLYPASAPFAEKVGAGGAGTRKQAARDREAGVPLAESGRATYDAGQGVIETMPLCTCYLTNNVEYIEALEHGHSGQAPQGMLALTVAQLRAMFP